MNVSFDSLVIEITRRCNMCCKHCMRGDAQNVDIDTAVIDKLFERVSSIGILTLTGGEPSLNVPALEYIAQKIKELDICVGGIYLVTNGKEVSDEFMMACLRLFMLAQDGSEVSGLALSDDLFHEDIPQENVRKLEQLTVFREFDKKVNFERTPLLDLGRAKTLDMFSKRQVNDYILEIEKDDAFNIVTVESDIAVTINGDILCGCDYSYDRTDNLKIASVYDKDWIGDICSDYAA